MSEHFSLQWDNFHNNMSAGMQSLLESEDLVDVTLAVEGRQLKAHKVVLSLCSPYFRQLFQSSPCKHPIVFMRDVSYTALIDLLQFVYHGEVQVAQENLSTFLKTAEALQIKGLAEDSTIQNEQSIEATKPTNEATKPPTAEVLPPLPIRSVTEEKRSKRLATKRARVSSPSPSSSAEAAVLPAENLIFVKMEPSDNIEASPDKEVADETQDSYIDETFVEEDNTLMETNEYDSKPGTSSDGMGESQPKNINEEVLRELTVADIAKLIPEEKFGQRKYLFLLQEQNGLPSETRVEDSPSTSTSFGCIDSLPSTNFAIIHNNFNLSKLLHNSISGKGILENYKKNLYLSPADRNVLTYLIAEYWINSNIKPEFYKGFSEIKRIFPTETESIYLNTKTQRGKLAEKYYSLRKKFRNAGFLKNKHNKKIEQDSSSLSSGMEDLLEDHLNLEMDSHYHWLKHNYFPESLVLEKWNITFPLRRKHILDPKIDIYAEWPILKQQIAVSLVELDFEKLHPSKKLLLFTKWQAFCAKIIPIFESTTKAPKNRDILKKIDDITNENSRNCVIINLLHTILIPTTQTVQQDEKKVRYKASILNSQTSLIVHVTNKSYIYPTFEKRKEEYAKRKWTIQPTVVVVGDTIENLTEFYIYVNDSSIYQVDTFLKALSVTFQLHKVLNIQYSLQCVQVWNLIEEYFYETLVSEKRSTNLNALLHQLISK